MSSDLHHHELETQAAAFRSAALRAGPAAAVATCPGWDVLRLVQHVSRMYAMANTALQQEPDVEPPRAPRPPAEFDDALTWWDERFAELTENLSKLDPAEPVWSYFRGGTPESWLRRMTHETAVHRLDAEHAVACLEPGGVHELIFDPALAADGVDEALGVLVPAREEWDDHDVQGRVLYHAADAGRAWLIEFQPRQAPRVGLPADAALEAEATVAGTADALYRHAWGRPSQAAVTGDTSLANLATAG
ncbi:maleylpyruvate isomerase N-terminal domain-containing protein [Saccharopolyspora sp. HNM0983]|uniref:Maleylpyruvate isomerase N-terminal domain-containing protein n=1 Tax=Saccharopolyspora montiporae TaxID=2781240 RepID=A0A929B7W2_9PSEU|nr:maleylpyruvate isomerase N-terminal domain-containing protein [Saccharopolyspora sp. HNM0983]MBE9374852.1 maleylpyruvate isomerase N-terminal domain-containing protein [Saccharopolyspora sp. HNM0983]